jgi:hypothetical protein
MKLSKKHTVYIAIGALGLGWLALDRVIGSPQQADAAATAEALLVAPSASPATKPAGNAAPPEIQVADHLLELAREQNCDVAATKDAFEAPPAWAPVRSVEPPANDRAVAVKSAAVFAQKHRLISVVVNGKRTEAMIDGRLLHVGDELDGYRLTSISKENAMLQSSGGTRVELRFHKDLSDDAGQTEVR